MSRLPWNDYTLLSVEALCIDLLAWYSFETSSSWESCRFCSNFREEVRVAGVEMFYCSKCPWVVFEKMSCNSYNQNKFVENRGFGVDALRGRSVREWNELRCKMLKEWLRRIRIAKSRRGLPH